MEESEDVLRRSKFREPNGASVATTIMILPSAELSARMSPERLATSASAPLASARPIPPSAVYHPGIVPCSMGRLSLGVGLIWAMLFMKVICTLLSSKRHVTVSWCGVS